MSKGLRSAGILPAVARAPAGQPPGRRRYAGSLISATCRNERRDTTGLCTGLP